MKTPFRKTPSLGIGWRPELALAIERRNDIGFVEVIAESIRPGHIPPALLALRDRGVAVIPHGVGLSLGGAELPDMGRIEHLAKLARELDSPMVSEHIAFVRAGGLESGHLLPLERTRDQLEILVENVNAVTQSLTVPLALENISALFSWPNPEMSEGAFLRELLERTDTLLLLDVANIHANAVNTGLDVQEFLDSLPLDRLAYVHVGGGHMEHDGGIYHDTHDDPVPPEAFAILESLAARTRVPGAMLERDAGFESAEELHAELDHIAAVLGPQEVAP